MGLLDGLKGMGKAMTGGGMNVEKINADWDAMAQQLGLSVERHEAALPEGVKVIQPGVDHQMSGNVNGVDVFWQMVSGTYMDKRSAGSYSYLADRKISFHVGDVGDWTVELQPRAKGMEGGVQTGMEEFDEMFFVATNDPDRFKNVFSQDILRDFVDRGWMHLVMYGDWMTVVDDYIDQFGQKATGGMKMMSAVNPLYGTSVSSMSPNVEITKRFFDVMTTLAKRVNP